jgi:hypothetical protein
MPILNRAGLPDRASSVRFRSTFLIVRTSVPKAFS